MVTLNLLPDIKKEFLQSQKIKRMFIVGSALVSAVFIGLVILLASFVFGVQRFHLSQVQGDIDFAIGGLQGINELDRIVTIQKQLEVLPNLHDGRPAVDRLFTYLPIIVPERISLSKINFQFGDVANAELSGMAQSTKAVNEFVDTLKNATFTYEGGDSINPFQTVVLEGIAVENDITYVIRVTFDPALFNGTISGAQLSIPNITSSPSVTERPTLFEQPEGGSQ